jgi:hypothetical protein
MYQLQSDQINELIAALSKAQGEIQPALKDNLNPHYKSKYADLHSVWMACRTALCKHGLAVMQTMLEENNKLMLMTTLGHSSGQWIRSYLPIVTQKNDAQGIGSAITYMRRYSLSAIVGVAPEEDDDGNAACEQQKKVATITTKQASELEELFSYVPEYKDVVLKSLKTRNIHNFKDLPIDLYERIKNGIYAKLNENEGSNPEMEKTA